MLDKWLASVCPPAMSVPTTVDEWFSEAQPGLLIAALKNRADDNRLRRLACTFAREAWQWLADERSRRAVEVAERYAHGGASDAELATAERDATAVLGTGSFAFLSAPRASREGRVAWHAARCAANAATTRPFSSTTSSAAWFAAQFACEALSSALFEDTGAYRASDPRWALHRVHDQRLCALVRREFPDSPFPVH
jgi:hypothetical protein